MPELVANLRKKINWRKMDKTVEECAHEVVLKNSTYKVNYLDSILYYKHHCSHRLNYGIFTNTDDNKEKIRKLSTSYRRG